MSTVRDRRQFLTTAACAGGCLFLRSVAARGGVVAEATSPEGKGHDFEKLTYCCYECRPEQCPTLAASLASDQEGKKKIAAQWQAKYGREFAPEDVFCFGCRVEPARQGANVKACDVRKCVVDKKLVSCAHCRELARCKREMWVRYPDFREMVLRIQKDVLAQ